MFQKLMELLFGKKPQPEPPATTAGRHPAQGGFDAAVSAAAAKRALDTHSPAPASASRKDNCCGSCGGHTAAPARVASIKVVLPRNREAFGTLEALDSSGALVSGPWPVVGKADRALAARKGNASCDWRQRFGDTPTGAYEVTDKVAPRGDAAAARLFGPFGVLVLRPLAGNAGLADANGRTALLIHGGADPAAATDGSLRVPNEAMAEILAAIPDDAGALRPRIRVLVEEESAVLAQPYRAVADAAASGSRRSSPASRAFHGGTGRRYRNDDYQVYYYNDPVDDFWGLYQQWYLWNAIEDSAPACDPDATDDADRCAADALGSLGYQTLTDGDLPATQVVTPFVAPEEPSAPAETEPSATGSSWRTTDTGASDTGSSSTDWSARASDTGASWTPSGGAYDR